jgi:hypothetical protein
VKTSPETSEKYKSANTEDFHIRILKSLPLNPYLNALFQNISIEHYVHRAICV